MFLYSLFWSSERYEKCIHPLSDTNCDKVEYVISNHSEPLCWSHLSTPSSCMWSTVFEYTSRVRHWCGFGACSKYFSVRAIRFLFISEPSTFEVANRSFCSSVADRLFSCSAIVLMSVIVIVSTSILPYISVSPYGLRSRAQIIN